MPTKEQRKVWSRTYYLNHTGQVKERMTKWREKNRERSRKMVRDSWKKYKEKVFDHYGRVCACCGEPNPLFLSIDHINGGGNKHRKITGSWYYRWMVLNGFPKEYQTLCMNCNFGKKMNRGVCPHKGGISIELS